MFFRERFLAKYFRKKTFSKEKTAGILSGFPFINELSRFLYNLELITAPSLFFL